MSRAACTSLHGSCSSVNAKNSYGGYTGMKPFWVYDGPMTQTYNHIMGSFKESWTAGESQTECISAGVAP